MELDKSDALGKVYGPDLILWRQVVCNERAELQEIEFERTDKGSLMAKVSSHSPSIFEPEVINHKNEGTESRGMVVFLREQPPEDWSHLIVTGVSHVLKQPVRESSGQGGAIFARPGKALDTEAYLRFRWELHRIYKENYLADAFPDILELCEYVWPEDQNLCLAGLKRLVFQFRFKDPEIVMDYQHLIRDYDEELKEQKM